MRILVNHMIIYITIIRYMRIHFIVCSLFNNYQFSWKYFSIIRCKVFNDFRVIVAFIDISSLKTRLNA